VHFLGLTTAQLHLLLAGVLAVTAGTYGVMTAVLVAAVLVTRHLVRRRLDAPRPRTSPTQEVST